MIASAHTPRTVPKPNVGKIIRNDNNRQYCAVKDVSILNTLVILFFIEYIALESRGHGTVEAFTP